MSRSRASWFWIMLAVVLTGSAILSVRIYVARLGNQHRGQRDWCSATDYARLVSMEGKVSILIDFTTITLASLQSTVDSVLANTDMRFLSDIVFINNECQNKDTAKYAVEMTSLKNVECKVIHIDAKGSSVGTGRARTEAIAHARGDILVFLTAGLVPQQNWLSPLLQEIAAHGETIAVPSVRAVEGPDQLTVSTFSWKLEINSSIPLSTVGSSIEIPVFDGAAFAARSDLLRAIGGYDSFFHRQDVSDSLALSFSAWLCGARVVQSSCSIMTSREPAKKRAVRDHSYAKYLVHVYLKKHLTSVTYYGLDTMSFNADILSAAESRSSLLRTLECLPFDWFVHKFKNYIAHAASRTDVAYQPNDVPPKIERDLKGRLMALYAGHCLYQAQDSVIGMHWCPTPLSSDHRFEWLANGRVSINGQCLESREKDQWYVVSECLTNATTQFFDYLPTTKQIKDRESGLCATHMTSSVDRRQIIQGAYCLAAGHKDIRFQLFVRNTS